jgi:hypothetical protein
VVTLTDSGFDLDLRSAEDEMEWEEGSETVVGSDRVELGVLDGTTPPEEWVEAVASGHVLVLAIEGDLNELAASFARDVTELNGQLVHFRDFLIVSPPGMDVDTDRL